MKSGFYILGKFIQISGAVLLIYCALIVARARIFQAVERRVFATSLQQTQAAAQALSPSYPARPEAAVPPDVAKPALGSVLGWIDIPRLNLSTIILEGDDTQQLQLGAGHVPGTAGLGEEGNVVIAAHRDSFFRPLRKVSKDDRIVLTTLTGSFLYAVEAAEVTGPDDVSVMQTHGEPELTLVTCYPFSYFGSAPNRFIVHAKRIGSDSAARLSHPESQPQ